MNNLIDTISCVVFLFCWMVGIVLAKGFWWTMFAICCPFYGHYKVVEYVWFNVVAV